MQLIRTLILIPLFTKLIHFAYDFIYCYCRRIIWLNSSDTAVGYSAEFATITMHAVATDPETVDRPCLYVQLDSEEEPEIDDDEEEEDGDGDGSPFPELRFIPSDPSTLDAIFQAFCEGAERNPDADAEDEGQGNLFFDQMEILAGAFDAAEVAEDVDEIVGDDPDRFGDAEEQEQDDDHVDNQMNGKP